VQQKVADTGVVSIKKQAGTFSSSQVKLRTELQPIIFLVETLPRTILVALLLLAGKRAEKASLHT